MLLRRSAGLCQCLLAPAAPTTAGRTFASTAVASDAAEGEAPKKRRHRGRNLYQFVQSLPENGLGYDIRPAEWRNKPGCFYTLTELKLQEFNNELKHGKAWGILTWEGKKADYIARISTPSPLGTTWELYREDTGKSNSDGAASKA
ncbi:hypothetical protein DFJ74DRAFT_700781 [Hyaloraphidium curvatum]|nr:hypothetical protein DFJ74DRAFT_700781 [Hyaloraphidium curvatum]